MNNRRLITTLLLTQGMSLIGSRMTGIAIGIWLFQTTGRATYLLLIPFFNEIPSLLTGHLVGVYVDKWHKKYTVILGDFGQAIGTVILLITLQTIGFKPLILYCVVALQGIFGMMQTTATDVMMTLLTDDTNRDRVNGLKEILFPVASFLGPALTALIYPLIGLNGVIFIDLLSFLIAVIVVGSLKLPAISNSQQIGDTSKINHALTEALQYLKMHKALLLFLVYIGFTNFMLNGPIELIIPYLLSLSFNEGSVAGMMSLMGIATFTGALFVTAIGKTKNRVNSILFLMLFSGIMMILFGISRKNILLSASLFLMMLPLPMASARFKSLLQTYVPIYLQGRVFSIAYQIAYGTAPISFILVGPLVDQWLEPNMLAGTWPLLNTFFGHHSGAGMGIALSFSGISIVISTLLAGIYKPFRNIDDKKL